jgi:hypothetical protein
MSRKSNNPDRVPLHQGAGFTGLVASAVSAAGAGYAKFLTSPAPVEKWVPGLAHGPEGDIRTNVYDGIANAAQIAAHNATTPRDMAIAAGLGLVGGITHQVVKNAKINRNLSPKVNWVGKNKR